MVSYVKTVFLCLVLGSFPSLKVFGNNQTSEATTTTTNGGTSSEAATTQQVTTVTTTTNGGTSSQAATTQQVTTSVTTTTNGGTSSQAATTQMTTSTMLSTVFATTTEAPSTTPQTTCPLPVGVANAVQSNPGPYYVGSRLSYRCHDGFNMSGFPSAQECGVDGLWIGDAPVCGVIDKRPYYNNSQSFGQDLPWWAFLALGLLFLLFLMAVMIPLCVYCCCTSNRVAPFDADYQEEAPSACCSCCCQRNSRRTVRRWDSPSSEMCVVEMGKRNGDAGTSHVSSVKTISRVQPIDVLPAGEQSRLPPEKKKIAKQLSGVWLPHSHSVRDTAYHRNTSTK